MVSANLQGATRKGPCRQLQSPGVDSVLGTDPGGGGGGSSPAPSAQPSPPRSHLLTLSGSQNHRLGPRLFCPPQCFSESCASNRYQKHLQGWNKRQDKPVSWCWGPQGTRSALRSAQLGAGATNDPKQQLYSLRLQGPLPTTEWTCPRCPRAVPPPRDRPALGGRWARRLLPSISGK